MADQAEASVKPKKGFALASNERRSEISALGGRSRKPETRTFSDPVVAAAAGRKGAIARAAKYAERVALTERDVLMRDAFQQGRSLTEIAVQLGVSKQAIHQRLKKRFGLMRRSADASGNIP